MIVLGSTVTIFNYRNQKKEIWFEVGSDAQIMSDSMPLTLYLNKRRRIISVVNTAPVFPAV
jgi:hypothetical protein